MTTDKWHLGLDLGSTAAKAVLLTPEHAWAESALDASGLPPSEATVRLTAQLFARRGLAVGDVAIVATGYGRAMAGCAGRKVTEITCHARGVRFLHPGAAAILDIGGQDAKAIRLNREGGVEDFAMNDKCAAGTGRFLEVAARRYGTTVEDLSEYCGHDPGVGEGTAPFEISSTCVVFAESELVGLNAKGVSPVESLRAVHRSVARRAALLVSTVGAAGPLYFTGGVAQNETLRKAVEQETGMRVIVADHAQFAGALGAALLA